MTTTLTPCLSTSLYSAAQPSARNRSGSRAFADSAIMCPANVCAAEGVGWLLDSLCRTGMSGRQSDTAPRRAEYYATMKSTTKEFLVNAGLERVELNIGRGCYAETLHHWHERANRLHRVARKERIVADPSEWLEPDLRLWKSRFNKHVEHADTEICRHARRAQGTQHPAKELI